MIKDSKAGKRNPLLWPYKALYYLSTSATSNLICFHFLFYSLRSNHMGFLSAPQTCLFFFLPPLEYFPFFSSVPAISLHLLTPGVLGGEHLLITHHEDPTHTLSK